MKTLLRHIPNGLYFQGPDKWTANVREAFNFKTIDRALQFISRWHLRDVEVAFAFNDRNHVTRVPVERISIRYAQD